MLKEVLFLKFKILLKLILQKFLVMNYFYKIHDLIYLNYDENFEYFKIFNLLLIYLFERIFR